MIPSLKSFFLFEENDAAHVKCGRCEILDDIKNAKEDKTLHHQEKAELLGDLGSDLKMNQNHSGNCPSRG